MNANSKSVKTKKPSRVSLSGRPVLLWVSRGISGFVAFLFLVSALAWVYDAYASPRALITYPAPGKFVEVNGLKMHYVCQGTTEPTLVFEAGIGGGELDWSPILPALAEHQQVCAFDRFGQDWSDPAPHPRSFATAADELHSALQSLGIHNPILVGHSLGGALVQIYAAKYEVTGVVLVEGLTADVVDPVVTRLGSYKALDPFARIGLLRPLAGTLEVNPAYSTNIQNEMLALRSRSQALLGVSDEGATAQQSAGAELREAEPKINAPLLIIAAEKSDVPGIQTGGFSGAAKALSERKPNSTYVLVLGARHYVQAEQPQVVIESIEKWLTELP